MEEKTFERKIKPNLYAPCKIVGALTFGKIQVKAAGFRWEGDQVVAYVTILGTDEKAGERLLDELEKRGNFICDFSKHIILKES